MGAVIVRSFCGSLGGHVRANAAAPRRGRRAARPAAIRHDLDLT
jgi:hypothetical protein